MNIVIYNDKWLVPHKCGTRYLDSIFNVPHNTSIIDDDVKKIIDSSGLAPLYKQKSISHLIIRDPLKMMESAIHTDILSNGQRGKEIDTTKLDDMEEILLSYIDGIGTAHWCPHLWFDLYHFLKIRPDIKPVQLDLLSNFVWDEMRIRKYGFPSHYNFEPFAKFKINYTRKQMIDFVKENFPHLWNRIFEMYEIDKVWYDRIVSEFYNGEGYVQIPKINKYKKKKLL